MVLMLPDAWDAGTITSIVGSMTYPKNMLLPQRGLRSIVATGTGTLTFRNTLAADAPIDTVCLTGYTWPQTAQVQFIVRNAAGTALNTTALQSTPDPVTMRSPRTMSYTWPTTYTTARMLDVVVSNLPTTGGWYLGRLAAGAKTTLTSLPEYGSAIRFADTSDVNRSRGGTRWVSQGAAFRELSVNLSWLNDTDRTTLLDLVRNRTGDLFLSAISSGTAAVVRDYSGMFHVDGIIELDFANPVGHAGKVMFSEA